MRTLGNRNNFCFGLGTIGRDMLYTLVSMYLLFYLTDILNLPDSTLWGATTVLTVARIFDAVNDPFVGILVDNTQSRFGKFKPWIASGAVFAGVFTVMMFTDLGLKGVLYLVVFALILLFWDLSFTANDIGYWSMLPSLSMDQKEREKIGAFARICANVGMFVIVAGIVPITNALAKAFDPNYQALLKTVGGDESLLPTPPVISQAAWEKAYFLFAVVLALIMIGGQCITLFGVKELKGVFVREEHTSLKDMFTVIFKNDQLLFTAISMSLFSIGYTTTSSFGLYFFKYAYGDENMYAIFAIVLGVAQITALAVFPLFSKSFDRRTLYTWSTILVVLGYVIFFFAPMDMLYIGTAGILIFLGQAFIQLLMLMFLADTIEYGQWKLGKRNDSVTFSLQPFINKIGGAIASGVVGVTVIISGINSAKSAKDVTPEGLVTMKTAMLVLPLITIVVGYLVYRYKYKIDSKMYKQILSDLQERGDIKLDEGKLP